MQKGTVKIKFSKGFGNNLFQYSFGRLLAEHHGLNFDHDAIPELGIKKEEYKFNKKLKTIKFKANSNAEAKKYDKDHLRWFSKEYKNCNFDFYSFMFYFEDYNIYKPYIEEIRKWFPLIEKNNTKDLVLHLRLENRIIWKTHYLNAVPIDTYRDVIKSNFKFERLYVVSDTLKWGHVTKKDIENIRIRIAKKYSTNATDLIPIKKSVEYMNDFVDGLQEFNPILHHSDKFIDDFNFIRSFNQIMLKNSTFSWWAAVLSDAAKVGLFKPWKPNKGKRNKNLGRTDFPGWFGWGD